MNPWSSQYRLLTVLLAGSGLLVLTLVLWIAHAGELPAIARSPAAFSPAGTGVEPPGSMGSGPDRRSAHLSAAQDPSRQQDHSVALVPGGEDPISGFGDTRIPLEQRKERIRRLAAQGDPASLQVLMRLGDAHMFLNRAAIEALGQRSTSAVADYLRRKLGDPDQQLVRAAVRSYARVLGRESVADLVGLLKDNRQRPDGYDQEVCTDIVRVLGDMQDERAAAALIAELSRWDEMGWNLAYGSEVVEALSRIGGQQAREALLAYADRLARNLPQDPLARQYVQTRIAEARDKGLGIH